MVAKIRKREKDKLSFFTFFTFFSLLVGIVVLSVANTNIKKYRNNLKAEIQDLQSQVQAAETKNKELERSKDQAGTTEYLEKVAREQFGMKAKGEEVIVISKEEEEKNQTQTKEQEGFWNIQKWLDWIWGK